MARKLRNQPAALDHALYEIEMLIYCVVKLSSLPDGRDGSAFLESFAVHARNLNEFFGRSKAGNGYMKPHEFVPWTYDYKFDSAMNRRASAQVAHLTYDRETPELKSRWDCPGITERLLVPAKRFLEAVARDPLLMAYPRNPERTDALLNLIPRLVFQQSDANVAPPQVIAVR